MTERAKLYPNSNNFMCRIAGQVSLNTNIDEKRNIISKMCLAMRHGGPDGEGLFLSDKNSICFGHRRLALIDLTADAAQPMTDVTGNFTITFNGEIYNYRELKSELQNLGHQFKNHSDTEVILVAYAHWGTPAFERLNGMFAFALFDKSLQKVFLVRDQSGIKPLYYRIKNNELLFASEIRAFREIGINQNKSDWKIMFLAFGFMPEPFTILEDVLMLPKASFLEWKMATETWRISNYLQSETATTVTDFEEAKQLIKTKLHAAVNRHLIADAPIGVFLSGGIDSGIIALEASDNKGAGLRTLSLTFDESDYDESHFQQILARKMNSQHHALHLNKIDVDENLINILSVMDQPSADGINTWFVSRLAKKSGLKAVLSGLGGDELFGGYPSFKRMDLLKKLSKLPDAGLRLIQQSPAEVYQKLAYLSLRSDAGFYLALRGFFAPKQIAAILNIPVKEVWQAIKKLSVSSYPKNDSNLFAAHLEQDFYMQNQLLRDADAMSMQHGIEIRVPFLDNEFLAAVDSLKSNLRFDEKLAKGLLIKSYADLLPAEIWKRKKMGFSFPLQNWLKQNQITTPLMASKNAAIASFTHGFLQDRVHWSKIVALHLVN